METVKNILKGILAFCSFVFVPRWGRSKSGTTEVTLD